MSLYDSERGNEEMETVYTCGMCETICKADEIESHSCLASLGIDRSRRRRNTDDNFMDEMRQLMQEPINVDIQQNIARPSPSAEFCNTIAYKLDALSEDARDRAMMRILEILREERHRDQA